jgi:hypothetical protein
LAKRPRQSPTLHTFRPRKAHSKKTGNYFTSFLPAMSRDKLINKGREVRHWRLHRRTNRTLADLANVINPIVRGWMNYWGHFYRSEMFRLLRRINTYLMRWARRKYRRLRAFKRVQAWWEGVVKRHPNLFVHWRWMRNFSLAG